jgi:hypothetical protein
MYHKPDSKFYDKDEDRRIYTSIQITPITLLQNCHPTKYRLDVKDAQKDVGNIVKRLNELDEANIFYIWKCGFPKNYMFVLERDIGLWRFYNPKAYVTPKTIKKIILSAKGMCNTMHKILEESGDKSTIHDVRNSFCEFVGRLVEKMDPEVHKDLEKWGAGRGYKEYLISLNNKINELTPYQGLIEDESFYDRLPLEVKNKLDPKPTTTVSKHPELESELAPKEENIVKKAPEKKSRVPVQNGEAKFETFKDNEPLKNSTSFFQYYRSIVKTQNNEAEFHEYKVELNHAALILDKLKEANQDEAFLRSWILYFVELKLKGNNAKNKDRTSLKSLFDTYTEYNGKYVGCGI